MHEGKADSTLAQILQAYEIRGLARPVVVEYQVMFGGDRLITSYWIVARSATLCIDLC